MLLDWLGERMFRYVHQNHLVYGACWEDPRIDREALGIGAGDRLLVITSAGCNVLDYLLEAPARIVAVDVNYRQNALLELKLAAIAELEWEDFFAMFGRGRHPRAHALYHEKLRRRLNLNHQPFWDRHWRLFCSRKSFYHRTTSGWFASWFCWYIRHVIRGEAAAGQLLEAASIEEQREIYDRALRDRFWRASLGICFRRDSMLALSGIPPQQRQHIFRDQPDILAYLKARAEHVIYHLPLAENYFWRVYLTGEYTPECCPRYLEQANFARLKTLISRVETQTNSVAGHLRASDRTYTHFVLLDHMDWLTGRRQPALAAEWQAIIDRAEPGAKLLWRSLGTRCDFLDEVRVRSGEKRYRLDELLRYDRALASDLQQRERANVYGSLHIATLLSP